MQVLSPTLIRVIAIIAKTMHDPSVIARIKADTTWQDLSADSLDRAEIFCELEEEFGCDLFEPACAKLTTIGDLAELVDKARAKVSA